MLEQLLKKGADPNIPNDAKATALMWAATDSAKTRVLLADGAAVNAVSADFRTALIAAAARPGGAPVVKLLLDYGADPNLTTVTSPLFDAAIAGDAASMELLLAHGVATRIFGGRALGLAARSSCSKCVELLAAANLDRKAYTEALGELVYLGDVSLVRLALDHGADVNAVDTRGRTPSMYAAISDFAPLEASKLLIARGVDVNVRSQHKASGDSGRTALDLAMLRSMPMVELLIESGPRHAIVGACGAPTARHHDPCGSSTEPSAAAANRRELHSEGRLCVLSQR